MERFLAQIKFVGFLMVDNKVSDCVLKWCGTKKGVLRHLCYDASYPECLKYFYDSPSDYSLGSKCSASFPFWSNELLLGRDSMRGML